MFIVFISAVYIRKNLAFRHQFYDFILKPLTGVLLFSVPKLVSELIYQCMQPKSLCGLIKTTDSIVSMKYENECQSHNTSKRNNKLHISTITYYAILLF